MSADTAPVVAPGLYRLRNVGSGLLLEVYGSARGSGAKVQQGAEKKEGRAASTGSSPPCTTAPRCTT